MKHRLTCPECGQPRLTRSRRHGLWEKMVSALFGKYPWRCKGCKARVMIKDRGIRRYKDADGIVHHKGAAAD